MLECVYIYYHKSSFRRYWNRQGHFCQFLPYHTKFLYYREKEMSGVIFQPSYYPQHIFEGITLFPTSVRLNKEVLYIDVKFNYTTRLCCNSLSLSWYTSVELIYVITISLSIGVLVILCTPLLEIISEFIYTSANVTFFCFQVSSDNHHQISKTRLNYFWIPQGWK